MEDRTCVECGVMFEGRKGGRPQRYCSKVCYTAAANNRARARSMSKPRKGPEPCAVCGTLTRRFGTTPYCADPACRSERNRRLSAAEYARNPERQGQAQWRYDMRRKYGVTVSEYERLLNEQDHRCRICGGDNGVTPLGRLKRLAVDHCHESSVVRGLLCTPCNLMIGYAKDRPHVLIAAAEYLTR